MMIVGLGNPGSTYALTRHNLGFMVVEQLASLLGSPEWSTERGVRWTTIDGHWLVEPYEQMNVSGPALKKFFDWRELALEPSRMIVVHDDLDFPLGTIKFDHDRSAGGHRGVQSLIDSLHSQNFQRLRLGIGSNREVGIPAEAYVLQRFTDTERPTVQEMVQRAAQDLKQRLAL